MRECKCCGGVATDEHHIFGGSNRQLSDKYGLTVFLCRECHGNVHAHPNSGEDLWLKRLGQQRFEKEYSREEFIRVFGKNYLG